MTRVKVYNPNTYNALDGVLAYVICVAATTGLTVLANFLLPFFKRWSLNSLLLCLYVLAVSLVTFLIVFAFSKVRRVSLINGGGFLSRKSLRVDTLMATVAVVGLSVLLTPIASDFAGALDEIKETLRLPVLSSISNMRLTGGVFLYLYVFVLAPVLPAIAEELLFRGIVMRGLSQLGKPLAIFLSAGLFALAYADFENVFYRFLLGVFLGYITTETRSLGVGIAAHFAHNFFQGVWTFVYAFAGDNYLTPFYNSVIEIMFFLLGAVCAIAALLYFARRHFSQKPSESEGVCAVIVDGDGLETITPWYRTGELLERGETGYYLTKKNKKKKRNRAANVKLSVALLVFSFLAGITIATLKFWGVF